MKVLLVDDDPVAIEVASNILKHDGYRVFTAEDGNEGLEILHREGVQLVISDWRMPGMNGLDFCREVRRNSQNGYVYFILLTARVQLCHTIEGLMVGADDYIEKPFNPTEFSMRVAVGKRIAGLGTKDLALFIAAKLADSRDPNTKSHLERVRSYCRSIARELQSLGLFLDEIDEQYIQLIYETSLLHDIGKVAVPDSILRKEGRLTAAEYEVMKCHTIVGAQIILDAMTKFPNATFLEMAYDIALTHHEKFDGTGYPNGLRSGHIPLSGRITAVADVYDALTTRRIYKEAFSHARAKQLIEDQSGRHFDPRIVKAFLSAQDEIIRIRETYDDSDKQESALVFGLPSALSTLNCFVH